MPIFPYILLHRWMLFFIYMIVSFAAPCFQWYFTAKDLFHIRDRLLVLVEDKEVSCSCSHCCSSHRTRQRSYFFIFFKKPTTCHDIAPAAFKTAAHLYHCLLLIIVYAQISHSYFGMKSLCIQVVKYDTFSY